MWQIAVFLIVWGIASAVTGFLLGRLFREHPNDG